MFRSAFQSMHENELLHHEKWKYVNNQFIKINHRVSYASMGTR